MDLGNKLADVIIIDEDSSHPGQRSTTHHSEELPLTSRTG